MDGKESAVEETMKISTKAQAVRHHVELGSSIRGYMCRIQHRGHAVSRNRTLTAIRFKNPRPELVLPLAQRDLAPQGASFVDELSRREVCSGRASTLGPPYDAVDNFFQDIVLHSPARGVMPRWHPPARVDGLPDRGQHLVLQQAGVADAQRISDRAKEVAADCAPMGGAEMRDAEKVGDCGHQRALGVVDTEGPGHARHTTWMKGATSESGSSGSSAFDALRDALARRPALRQEVEAALDLNVRRVNPSDRANRFGSGAAVEWILAAVAYAANVLAVPGGHNSNGFDLRDLREDARGLWSVKNQTNRGEWRITNGLGGAGGGFMDPTIFVSPALPGLTFADPRIHQDLASKVVVKSDAVTLPAGAVIEHAHQHPECVAPCAMPKNPGTGMDDPWMDYVESLLSADRFPQLSRLFVAAKPVSSTLTDELQRLILLRDSGSITAEQFNLMITRLGS